MSYNSTIIQNPAVLESGKFVEIVGDSRFPSTSVIRVQYPEDFHMPAVSSVEVYPKYAVVTYMANASDIVVSLSTAHVDIGNVGIIDASTGTDVFAKITQTDTVNGYAVGSISTNIVTPVTAIDYPTTNWDVVSAALSASSYDNNVFVSLPSNNASVITISNVTTGNIWIKRTSRPLAFPLPKNSSIDINLMSNTNEVALATDSNQAVTVYGIFTK